MEIRDISASQSTAKITDYLILQDPETGITYKITKGDFLAGVSSIPVVATTPLLDGITGVVSARSVRKLLTSYAGKALQVSLSDNSVKDIDFIKGDLDSATLKTFVGNNSGYVNKFYDQVGLFIATSTSPPKIIDNGILQTAGSKPTITYAGNFLSTPSPGNYPITMIAAVKISSSTNGAFIKYGGSTSGGFGVGVGDGTCDNPGINIIGLSENVAWLPSTAPISTSQMSIVEINSTGTDINVYLNGLSVRTGGSSYPTSGSYNIGGYAARTPNCNISEDIVFNQIISAATRTKIVANMMSYYGIT